jgi:hypothetical protein
MKQLFFTSLLCVLFAATLTAQDDWHTYPFREIGALIQQEEKLYQSTPARADIVISAKPFPSKTRVTFTGAKRPIGQYGKTFVKIWVETRGLAQEKSELLIEEFQFKEKGVEYWLPVLSQVAPGLSRELKAGDEITIYYFYLGGFNAGLLQQKDTSKDKSVAKEDDSMRWIFAVERVERVGNTFTERSLGSATDPSMEQPGKIVDVWFDERKIKLRAKVVFTGDVRPVSGKRKRLRDLWFEKSGAPAGTEDLMQNEGRFLEGDKEYWILLRNRTLEQIQEIIGKGGTLYVNTILAGAVRESDKVDWLFMAGEYSR